MELYSDASKFEDGTQDQNYYCEIWIPWRRSKRLHDFDIQDGPPAKAGAYFYCPMSHGVPQKRAQPGTCLS